ncbi:MAG: YceI family protein [Planctomycetota bacterium]
MRLLLRASFAVSLVLAASAVLSAGDTTYYVGHSEKFVNIQFESETDLETIIGSTNKATGEIHVDLDKGEGSVNLTVAVADLTTGIAMRDDHMRGDNWLQAAKFPDITFVSKKVKLDKDKGTAEVTGDFSMHGVAKEKSVTATWAAVSKERAEKAKFPAGDWIRIVVEFDVKLGDHGVDAGKGGGKVSDVWKLKMTLFACTSKPEKK